MAEAAGEGVTAQGCLVTLERQRLPRASWIGKPGILASSGFDERGCLKIKVESNKGSYLTLTSGLHTHAHMYTYNHIHACTI